MKSITSKWFECAIRYEKTLDDGRQQKVTEKYVVDALSFTEAEATIIKEMTPFVSGDMEIRAIALQPYNEVFFSDNELGNNFFKVKVEFITLDERTSKEKRSRTTYLVQAHTPEDAISHIKAAFNDTALDYEIKASSDTKVLDVFLHNNN